MDKISKRILEEAKYMITTKETIREIARISEGDITDAGINHAYELRKYA